MPAVAADELIAALRSAGQRVTVARRVVCEVLAVDHHRHLTIAELHRLAEARAGSGIDISTIYRTVDVLERAGLVHHVHLGPGPAVLHISDHAEHHHLTCHECGRTVDVPIEELEALTRDIGRRHGFRIDSAHFALVGRCERHES